jgi:hypothetical protein
MATGYSTTAGSISTRYEYTTVQFNGYDINNVVDITERFEHNSSPSRSLALYKIARRDGEKLVSAFFARKEIIVTGFIQSTTTAGLETLIDTLKSNFQTISGYLDIEYAGGIRRYDALYSNLVINRDPDHLDWCPFSVTFIVPSGKGYNIDATVSTYTITASPYSNYFVNLGGTDALPILTLTVNSQSGLDSIALNSGSNTLTIARTYNNSDVLVIDFNTWIVTVNGTAVDYTGSFPTWPIGYNVFTLTLTGSFNISGSFSYHKLYL